MKEIPSKFKTEDGREFKNKKEAERHEEFLKAWRAFENSRDALGRLLAKTLRTADGHLLNFGTWDYYYQITDGWHGMPELKEISFYAWNIGIDNYDGKMDVRDIAIWQDDSSKKNRTYYKVSELYADKKAATRALLVAQELWLSDRMKETEELRKRIEQV